jgi:hypothetical protein
MLVDEILADTKMPVMYPGFDMIQPHSLPHPSDKNADMRTKQNATRQAALSDDLGKYQAASKSKPRR